MAEDLLSLVVADPMVGHGQACIRGTRVPVSVVLDCLADGMSDGEILAEYPALSVPGIRVAAAYGARLAREDLVPLRTAP
ncbi:DUF433 domain-containing protein [Frankia sp. CIT1]|uniref:DUF433 domain-containing protein n=1 Tax=Frankia sp. CIT1 TaxID=2880974 RepID=UPI001EF65CD5|nr:DUF433 domain-containing protein [Frankia sp. CIT1]